MPTPPHARHAVRAALQAARDRHVDEPTIIYRGRRYTESELRALQDAGRLPTLGALAAGIPCYLRALDAARTPRFGPAHHVMIVEGLDWGDDLPLETAYLFPAGWTYTRYHYVFEDRAPDSHSQEDVDE